MELNDYQSKIIPFDAFDKASWDGNLASAEFIEKVLGLTGEAGETGDKIKKLIRDQNGELSKNDKLEIEKELGDVLWYVATIARYLDLKLEDVAKLNIEKLQSRLDRNKIHGSGDNR